MRSDGYHQGDHKYHSHDPRHDSSFSMYISSIPLDPAWLHGEGCWGCVAMLILHPHCLRHDLSFSSVVYTHFKCPVSPGLTRKRCVGMIVIIAAGDAGRVPARAGDAGVSKCFLYHFKCPVGHGFTRKRGVVMIVTIAAGDAGDA